MPSVRLSQDVRSPRMWACRWTFYIASFSSNWVNPTLLLYNGLTNMTQSNTLTTTWKKRLDVVIEVEEGKDLHHHHPKEAD